MATTQKMKPEVKEKLVTALLSNEYEQGIGYLRTKDNQFCCLGVLTDLAIKDGLDIAIGTDERGNTTYDGEAQFLPEKVKEWAGLADDNGEFHFINEFDEEETDTLVDRNDSGWSFKDIANLIESEF